MNEKDEREELQNEGANIPENLNDEQNELNESAEEVNSQLEATEVASENENVEESADEVTDEVEESSESVDEIEESIDSQDSLEEEEEEEEEDDDDYEEEDREDSEEVKQLKKIASYVIGVIVVIILAVFAYNNMTESSMKEAAEADLMLQRILAVYEQNDLEKALNGDPNVMFGDKSLKGLKAIAEEYSGQGSGQLAAFFAGRLLIEEGNFQDASRYFDIASSNDSKVIQLGVKSAQAAIAETNQNYSSAASLYEAAANLTDEKTIKSRLLYFSAYNSELAGNNDAAIKNYEAVKNMNFNNSYNEFAGLSIQGLQRLGMKIE